MGLWHPLMRNDGHVIKLAKLLLETLNVFSAIFVENFFPDSPGFTGTYY